MMIPSTEGMRNVYASVQALGIRSGPPGAIEYNHGKAKFDAWLAAIEREAAARALEEAANAWQINGWANDMPKKGAERAQIILHMAQAATEMLCARAAEIRGGEE